MFHETVEKTSTSKSYSLVNLCLLREIIQKASVLMILRILVFKLLFVFSTVLLDTIN